MVGTDGGNQTAKTATDDDNSWPAVASRIVLKLQEMPPVISNRSLRLLLAKIGFLL
jgi:hypothetical protein